MEKKKQNHGYRALLLGILLLPALAGCAKNETEEESMTYRQISMDEAVELMKEETGYLILDVRTIEEYESGHIPGAVCVPNEMIGDTAPAELPDKEQLIFVYCRSGNRSKQAAKKLIALGYSNIVEFGGIIDWNGETEK